MWLALTSYSCWTERVGEERCRREKEKGSKTEGNASARPYNPGNEVFGSAGKTRLRNSSTAAAGERQEVRREEERKVLGPHVTVTRFDGQLVREGWREERERRMRGVKEEM